MKNRLSSVPFPKALVFDWDNTLVDTWSVIHQAYNKVLPQFGHVLWTMEETQKNVSLSLRDFFPSFFGERWEEAKKVYLDSYKELSLKSLDPLSGVSETLPRLKELVPYLAIVSNKTDSILKEEVERLGWGGYFDRTVGAGAAPRDKPAKDPVFKALEGNVFFDLNHGIDRKAWFIGDSHVDMECAHTSGCHAVFLSNAMENKELLKKNPPDMTVSSIPELFSVIYNFKNNV